MLMHLLWSSTLFMSLILAFSVIFIINIITDDFIRLTANIIYIIHFYALYYLLLHHHHHYYYYYLF